MYEVSPCPVGQHGTDELIARVCGERKNMGITGQVGYYRQTVGNGHSVIKQRDRGTQPPCCNECLLAVTGFPYDADRIGRIEICPYNGSHERIVVDDQYSYDRIGHAR